MNEKLLQQLNNRNDRIIEAVKARAKAVCHNSIALIGITGSFLTGDMHEKSDLDLLIVTNDKDGWKVASCFIIEDVAFDIYCHSWEKLEKMAEYNEPFISKLVDLKFVYCADDKYMQKYLELREKLKKTMASPFENADFDKAKKYWDMALKSYADVMMEDDFHTCKYASCYVMHYIEFAIYMLNKSYVKRGVRYMPKEVCSMEKLPGNFNLHYLDLLKSDTLGAIKESATLLMNCVKKHLKEIEYTLTYKKSISPDCLTGSYEEIVSNWKNKMRLAVETNDAYLSFVTAVSCQLFYDDMYKEYEIDRVDLMKHFDINDLSASEQAFNSAMEEYKQLYAKTGTRILYYNNLDEFESDYLK